MVGTTDEEVTPGTELAVTKGDVEYLLRHLNQYVARRVTPDEIVSGFAGARPLVAANDEGDTKSLSRDDVVEVDPASGLISIMGGKWTTYRAMAEDTIHVVQKALGVPQTESRTHTYVLYGGQGFTQDFWRRLCTQHQLSEETARHLSAKFGTAAEDILGLTKENADLGQPIASSYPAIRAEVIYSVREEMAATLEDVLARRIGLQLFSWRDAIQAAPVVGQLMADELGWSAHQKQGAVDEYIARIQHHLVTAGVEAQK